MNDPHAKEVHQRFIHIANGLSDDLASAIRQVGPQEFQPNDSLPLTHRLCRSVAGQQLSVIAAQTIWDRVIDAAEVCELIHFFTEENAELMRNCGLSAAKVRAMCGIAKEGRAGNLEADHLRAISHQERSAELTRLWGVGQWRDIVHENCRNPEIQYLWNGLLTIRIVIYGLHFFQVAGCRGAGYMVWNVVFVLFGEWRSRLLCNKP